MEADGTPPDSNRNRSIGCRRTVLIGLVVTVAAALALGLIAIMFDAVGAADTQSIDTTRFRPDLRHRIRAE